jgi:hypothetical protein
MRHPITLLQKDALLGKEIFALYTDIFGIDITTPPFEFEMQRLI